MDIPAGQTEICFAMYLIKIKVDLTKNMSFCLNKPIKHERIMQSFKTFIIILILFGIKCLCKCESRTLKFYIAYTYNIIYIMLFSYIYMSICEIQPLLIWTAIHI